MNLSVNNSPDKNNGINNNNENDKFKASFKRFRHSWLTSSEVKNDVFDGDSLPEVSEKFNYEFVLPLKTLKLGSSVRSDQLEFSQSTSCSNCNCSCSFFGLKPVSEWTVLKFQFPEGLIFIKNPFTPQGQRYWISKCVYEYPINEVHVTNIDNLKRRQESFKLNTDTKCQVSNKDDFYKKLRWITFGYHHDWDTKIYSEDSKCKFPSDLADLTKYLSLVLGFNDFNAEAAIVNYYHMESTLSGHQDRSEDYQEAPLFSISFGQTGIFLIGGETKDVKPLPIYLKSGDIAIMSGKSRLSYHGVPKIVQVDNNPTSVLWTDPNSSNNEVLKSRLPPDNCCDSGNSSEDEPKIKRKKQVPTDASHLSKIRRACCSSCSFVKSCNLMKSETQLLIQGTLEKWDSFLSNYIAKSRININVRQVLRPGQLSLTSHTE